MTIPVVIVGIVVLSVTITVCTILLFVSYADVLKDFIVLYSNSRDFVYGRLFKIYRKQNG